MIILIRYINIPGAVYDYYRRSIYLGAGGGAPVPTVAQCASSGNGGDVPARIDLADTVIIKIRYVDIPGSVHDYSKRKT